MLLHKSSSRPRVNVHLPDIIPIKVISMGTTGSGKSCLIKRYCEERFVSKYITTIGIDYGVKQVTINDREVNVHFWDLAGPPEYLEIRNEFYKDTEGVLLVYDINNRKSFEQLDAWIREGERYGMQDPVIVVCGNKSDLKRRAVTEREGREWAASRGYFFLETSAATGSNVTAAFGELFKAVLEKQAENDN